MKSHYVAGMKAASIILLLLLVLAPSRASIQAQENAANEQAVAAQQENAAESQAEKLVVEEGAVEGAGLEDENLEKEVAEEKAQQSKKPYFEYWKEWPGKIVNNVLISPFSNTLFLVFLITVVGYLLGKIEIKGVGLGTAGVFLVALVFGHFGFANNSLFHDIGLVTIDEKALKESMKLVEQLGLLCFVTSVGFIAGPKFFQNLKKNALSYGLLAVVIIGSASLTCAAVILLTDVDAPMAVGILSGSLTTTPGFSAAKEALNDETLKDIVTIGHAIGYPFGVVGVVLFVQIVPKMLGADMLEEQKKLNAASDESVEKKLPEGLLKLDPIGLGPFALAIILGILLGKIYIPLPGGTPFALGNTGGALIMGLLLGHFGRLGPISMRISGEFLKSFREYGLVLFLIGAGVPGGGGFVKTLNEQGYMLFVYGAIMELVPMILGFFVARYVVKLCLLNNLGSITGGMTSTPALGALINTAKTDDVAAAYAATYPVALVLVVLASQFLVTLL